MSTAASVAVPASTSHVDDADLDEDRGPLPEPSTRGTLEIADRVVEKVAAQAVREIDLASGAPRTVFGQKLGATNEQTAARTSAQVDGDLVTVTVSMSVRWPAPIRDVAAQVRARVTERVLSLTGLTVAEVDIDVATLLTGRDSSPRVR